jgi:alpha-L-fucosidase 2
MANEMKRTLEWLFPLPRTHTGALLGNGTQGLMVWGSEKLHITVGRAGFWDHRGGSAFASKTTFKKLRALLEAGDEAAIMEIFAPREKKSGWPDRPHQIGCGRLELAFPDGLRPHRAVLDMEHAVLTVTLQNAAGRSAQVVVRQAMDAELAWVELPPELRSQVAIKFVSTWDYVGEVLSAVGVKPPIVEKSKSGGTCWQQLPEDPGLAIAWQDRGDVIAIGTALGESPVAAANEQAERANVRDAQKRAEAWWAKYWADVPQLALPDAVLQRAYDYGVYKQAGLTTPDAVAATLQGPWLEEYQLPPWSCDYHFNINVQMVYWPCLQTNRLEHFAPMWALIKSWWPTLSENAKAFFEADEALMLPHAVDDRCRAVGQFWTGTIDHACTAWMAQMAWQHYRYSMDKRVLEDIAWPMLVGAFNGYWAMVEEIDEGGKKRLSLPVTVSPEYGGSGMTAWGRDASFQLAALHCVAAVLPQAAQALGRAVDPRWARVQRELPRYTTAPQVYGYNLSKLLTCTPEELPAVQRASLAEKGGHEERRPGPRIALWEGRDLDTSHRHPSHLAGIYPFRTIEPASERDRGIVQNSLYHWQREGGGAWSGWAIPFAALILARCDLIDAAVQWLHIWDETFTNEGYGTLHDAAYRGFSVIAGDGGKTHGEIMQMDAGMGAVSAILELLVQCRGVLGEEIHVLPVVPTRWRELSFNRVRAEGAFQVGATVVGGVTVEVRVKSLAGERLKLVHGLGDAWQVNGRAGTGGVFATETKRGEEFVLVRGS